MNSKKGISLIILIITIIIMIVLAAILLLSLNSSNIVNKANKAKLDNNVATVLEDASVKLAEYELVKASGREDLETPKVYIEEQFEGYYANQKGIIVGTKYTEGSTTVPIPLGFNYVTGTKDTGLVVADNEGNEFVWVPVEYTDAEFDTKFARKAWTINGATQNLQYYIEPSEQTYNNITLSQANDVTGEYSEYNAMKASVKEHKGFYIARYEAGDGDATVPRTEVTPARKVVSKKGAYIYNYVPWGKNTVTITPFSLNGVSKVAGAVELSRNMYAGSTSVVSHLTYGVEWDAALNFISTGVNAKNVNNSVSWGNHSNSTGAAATNSGSSNMNYTTGRNDAWQAKNIYDIAGNNNEWTMEATTASTRSFRSGSSNHSGATVPASYRATYPPETVFLSLSFRPSLYIK